MTTYTIAYAVAWVVGVVGILSGVLAGSAMAPLHPNWLGFVSAGCVGLAAVLPQVTRTPAKREAAYMAAFAGALPDDLARKHPTLSAHRERPADPNVPGPGT